MANFLVTDGPDGEWELLRNVDHLARNLYFAMRRVMDYGTGIVGGPSRRVSWQSFREECEVPGRPGVRLCQPTEGQLRRRAAQLEKFGLLKNISTGLTLKFKLLVAHADSRVRKKADRKQTASHGRKPSHSADSRGGHKKATAKAGTHPVSGKPITPSSPPPHQLPDEDGASINPSGAANTPACEANAEQQHRLSEQPQRDADSVGDGPAGQLAESGNSGDPPWSPVLAWPRRIAPDRREAAAHALAPLPHRLWQRVLDEWDGAMATGKIHQPGRFFDVVVTRAKSPGWLPDYADAIASQRERARGVDAMVRQAREAPPPDADRRIGACAVANIRSILTRRPGRER